MALERLAELGCVVPDMGRELRPPQQPLLIDKLLVIQVVGLMAIAESVEASLFRHLDASGNLLVGEGMTLAELMFVLACSVDEHRLAIEMEPLVAIVSRQRPAGGADAIGCVGALRGLAVALDNGVEIVKIGVIDTPQFGIADGRCLADNLCFAG